VSGCIVTVLNGIEISHKLFMPELVGPALAIRDSGTVLGMGSGTFCSSVFSLLGAKVPTQYFRSRVNKFAF